MKSKVFGLSVSMGEPYSPRVTVTFYRYCKGHDPAFDDWMQSHTNLTESSCRRLWGVFEKLGTEAVGIFPDRLWVTIPRIKVLEQEPQP